MRYLSKGTGIYPLMIGTARYDVDGNEAEMSVGARHDPHDPRHLVRSLHRRYSQDQVFEFGGVDVAYENVGNFCEWAYDVESV